MIDEGILGKCLRISSSPSGLRISPLTPRYVFPRQPPLIPCSSKFRRCEQRAEGFENKLSKWIVKTDKRRTHWSMLCHSMLCHTTASGCLEHAVFFTVITTGGQACVACEMLTSSANSISTPVKERVRKAPVPSMTELRRRASELAKTHNSVFNYEPFNSSSVNIRYWSWNYRGCWHQTCPPIVTRWWVYIPPIAIPALREAESLFLFAASPVWHWAIYAPAALRRSGSCFSGSLSGIEP